MELIKIEHLHTGGLSDKQFNAIQEQLTIHNEKLNFIMATQKELADQLTAVGVTIAKIGTETTKTLDRVKELEVALNGSGTAVSPELQAAFDALKAQVTVVDDLIADVPPPPPVV